MTAALGDLCCSSGEKEVDWVKTNVSSQGVTFPRRPDGDRAGVTELLRKALASSVPKTLTTYGSSAEAGSSVGQ